MKLFTLPRSVTNNNYLQLLFVFVAFALMAITSFLFIGRILQNRLLSETNELLFSAESNVKAGLSEAETTLLNSYHIVQGMIERNAGHDEILNYLTLTTEWLRERDQGLMIYNGIYGYINGELYDSVGMNPGDDYIPQTRPWYQIGIRSGKSTAFTVPYRDWRTGDTIISAVRNIHKKNGDMVGLLVIDIDINWLVEYVGTLALASGGYGMLLSQNLTFMTYPDSAYIGRQLQDLGGSYPEIARKLRSEGEMTAAKIKNQDGSSAIVFFKHIFNNWYIGIVTPQSRFYRDLYESARILAALGIVLALSLCLLLMRLTKAKTRAIEKSLSLERALLKTMAELVERRDGITGSHIDRTQRGIKILLDEVQKSGIYQEKTKDWDIDLIIQSSQLHDIGKISIEDRILRKPGKLDEDEFNEMKKHTTFGEQIITKIETMTKENEFLKYAKILAVSHHEKWDGTGYPNGLKEDEIPLLGRIMAIADVYDALVSDRSYKKAYTHEEAVKIIADSRGKHFDPYLVDIFLSVSDKFDGGTEKQT
jgi:HD-GYP domain-containing protein (c-di-GMP phosphodiesterase class II)